jgi:hypothetical protein
MNARIFKGRLTKVEEIELKEKILWYNLE